jgi:hypothetical protein
MMGFGLLMLGAGCWVLDRLVGSRWRARTADVGREFLHDRRPTVTTHPMRRVVLCIGLLATGVVAQAGLERAVLAERPPRWRATSTRSPRPRPLGRPGRAGRPRHPRTVAGRRLAERVYEDRPARGGGSSLWINYSRTGPEHAALPRGLPAVGGAGRGRVSDRVIEVATPRGRSLPVTRLGYAQGELLRGSGFGTTSSRRARRALGADPADHQPEQPRADDPGIGPDGRGLLPGEDDPRGSPSRTSPPRCWPPWSRCCPTTGRSISSLSCIGSNRAVLPPGGESSRVELTTGASDEACVGHRHHRPGTARTWPSSCSASRLRGPWPRPTVEQPESPEDRPPVRVRRLGPRPIPPPLRRPRRRLQPGDGDGPVSPTRCTTSARRATSGSRSTSRSTRPTWSAWAPSASGGDPQLQKSKPDRFYQASSSEMYARRPAPGARHAVPPPQPVRLRQALRPLADDQLPGSLRDVSPARASCSTTRALAGARRSSPGRSRSGRPGSRKGSRRSSSWGNLDAKAPTGASPAITSGHVADAPAGDPGRLRRRPPARPTRSASSSRLLRAARARLQDHVEFDERYTRPSEVDVLLGDPSKAKKNWAGSPR